MSGLQASVPQLAAGPRTASMDLHGRLLLPVDTSLNPGVGTEERNGGLMVEH